MLKIHLLFAYSDDVAAEFSGSWGMKQELLNKLEKLLLLIIKSRVNAPGAYSLNFEILSFDEIDLFLSTSQN